MNQIKSEPIERTKKYLMRQMYSKWEEIKTKMCRIVHFIVGGRLNQTRLEIKTCKPIFRKYFQIFLQIPHQYLNQNCLFYNLLMALHLYLSSEHVLHQILGLPNPKMKE